MCGSLADSNGAVRTMVIEDSSCGVFTFDCKRHHVVNFKAILTCDVLPMSHVSTPMILNM